MAWVDPPDGQTWLSGGLPCTTRKAPLMSAELFLSECLGAGAQFDGESAHSIKHSLPLAANVN